LKPPIHPTIMATIIPELVALLNTYCAKLSQRHKSIVKAYLKDVEELRHHKHRVKHDMSTSVLLPSAAIGTDFKVVTNAKGQHVVSHPRGVRFLVSSQLQELEPETLPMFVENIPRASEWVLRLTPRLPDKDPTIVSTGRATLATLGWPSEDRLRRPAIPDDAAIFLLDYLQQATLFDRHNPDSRIPVFDRKVAMRKKPYAAHCNLDALGRPRVV